MKYDKDLLKEILVAYLIEFLAEKKRKENKVLPIGEKRASEIADSIIMDYEGNLN